MNHLVVFQLVYLNNLSYFIRPLHTGYITDKILSEIKEAAFVVADFTHNNQGVYFEAGYARAEGLEVFHLARKEGSSDKLHFDVSQINTLFWDKPSDIEEDLYYRIKNVIGKF